MWPNLNRQVYPYDVLLLCSEPTLRGTDHLLFLFFVCVCCSSPHLMEVRERIRINGKPLAKDKFAKYFFDCWDNLHNNGDVSGPKALIHHPHNRTSPGSHIYPVIYYWRGTILCTSMKFTFGKFTLKYRESFVFGSYNFLKFAYTVLYTWLLVNGLIKT